jgi:CRISPR-associated protein Cmr2
MTDAILIFTFSPVQSFITEARRAADLYTGSQILVELAKATGKVLIGHTAKKQLIYPAELSQDVPNKLVALVPWDNCEIIADEAHTALLKRWGELAKEARDNFAKINMPFDESIWRRQMADDYLWETYWSAASMEKRAYNDAYQEAESALIAVKFTRPFKQVEELGFKDTLSGKRQALCPADLDGQKYWLEIGKVPAITPIKIRPSAENHPRERLDAIGLIKRFRDLEDTVKETLAPFHGFPSTSSMASASFLDSARKCPDELKTYQDVVAALLPDKKYIIRDGHWRYDGDLFYPETLRSKRLKSDYNKIISETDPILVNAQNALKNLYKAIKDTTKDLSGAVTRPSPYYAIIALDGDGMGKHIRSLMKEDDHRAFSVRLREFSSKVNSLAETYLAKVVYNGGDDVLAMAPLKTAFTFARDLAKLFNEATKVGPDDKGLTASAGIAIAHHLSPLSYALQTARRAEKHAKNIDELKDAVCIIALKRSGEPIEVSSKWNTIGGQFEQVISQFENNELSSKLPYDVASSAYALPQANGSFEAELRRLINRHLQKGTGEQKKETAKILSVNLRQWAESFPTNLEHPDKPQQADILASWLSLARFVAKGGRE